jgi:hypothetical protein
MFTVATMANAIVASPLITVKSSTVDKCGRLLNTPKNAPVAMRIINTIKTVIR